MASSTTALVACHPKRWSRTSICNVIVPSCLIAPLICRNVWSQIAVRAWLLIKAVMIRFVNFSCTIRNSHENLKSVDQIVPEMSTFQLVVYWPAGTATVQRMHCFSDVPSSWYRWHPWFFWYEQQSIHVPNPLLNVFKVERGLRGLLAYVSGEIRSG